MKDLTKGIMIGFILGVFFISCNGNIFADEDDSGSYGEIGTVEWNPLYVKIVE